MSIVIRPENAEVDVIGRRPENAEAEAIVEFGGLPRVGDNHFAQTRAYLEQSIWSRRSGTTNPAGGGCRGSRLWREESPGVGPNVEPAQARRTQATPADLIPAEVCSSLGGRQPKKRGRIWLFILLDTALVIF